MFDPLASRGRSYLLLSTASELRTKPGMIVGIPGIRYKPSCKRYFLSDQLDRESCVRRTNTVSRCFEMDPKGIWKFKFQSASLEAIVGQFTVLDHVSSYEPASGAS